MITPGYGLTATERVLPRMALDFTTASLDSRVTVTRALDTATRFNSNGYLEIVNANLPRFDFNPSTLVCRGLLIEESRTNLLVRSNAFTTSPWQTQFTVASAQNVTGPDNVANSAWTLTDNDAANTAFFFRALIVANNSSAYSASVFIRKTTGATTFPALELNILGGSVGVLAAYVLNTNTGVATAASTNATASSAIVQDAGEFWRLCISTSNNSTGNTVAYFNMDPAVNTNAGSVFVASTTGSAVFYGAQLEVGAFSTSYIPTTTTSLTRNADVVSMTGTNFSDWYNATQGALIVTASLPVLPASSRAALSLNSAFNNRMSLYRQSTGNIAAYINPPGSAMIAGQTATAGVNWSSGLAYDASTVSFAAKGVSAASSLNHTVNLAAINTLTIGNSNSGLGETLCGHVAKARYYNIKLTDAELRAFTK